MKSCCFTDSREQGAREQSHHNFIGISTNIPSVMGDATCSHTALLAPCIRPCCLSSEQICSYCPWFPDRRWVSSGPQDHVTVEFIYTVSLGLMSTLLMSIFWSSKNNPALSLNSHLPYTCPLYINTTSHITQQNNKLVLKGYILSVYF